MADKNILRRFTLLIMCIMGAIIIYWLPGQLGLFIRSEETILPSFFKWLLNSECLWLNGFILLLFIIITLMGLIESIYWVITGKLA